MGKHYLKKTSAVGMYPQGASPYGICDLIGNVWEWCLNEYEVPERVQETGSANRVLRGTSWNTWIVSVAATERLGDQRLRSHPDSRYYGSGFRVVCVVSVP